MKELKVKDLMVTQTGKNMVLVCQSCMVEKLLKQKKV